MVFIMCKVKEWMEHLADTVELTRREYTLTIAVSLLGGVVLGFLFAPKRTRHTVIGSNNGPKSYGNEHGRWDELEEMDDWDDMEEMDGIDGAGDLEIGDDELSFH